MSFDAAADSAATPSLNLTAEEKRVYGDLFKQADPENLRVVTGDAAISFFDKTLLDSRILGEIWQIADRENRGFLTPTGFGIVLRLIGHAQAGREPRPELAFQQGPLPRFGSLQTAPASVGSPPPPGSATLQAQGTGGPLRIPPLTPDKVAQYSSLFERQPLQGNLLSGEQARQIFDKSGMPNETLSRIWALADTEQRGALRLSEFVIAMHLLASMKMGVLRALPTILPAGLYEAATQRLSGPPPRQSPNHTGLAAIPRQMSGSTQQQQEGSPLGRAPIPLQTTGSPTGDWAVFPADKEKFDHLFATLDKNKKGFITGDEAVPFFSQFNLSEDVLAQIWDLADFNSQGHLTPDGFAVAMCLIRQQRSGRSTALPASLPASLPPNLIPPSLRSQPRPANASPAFDPPPMTRPLPAQPKSALDDLFGLDSSVPSPALVAPAQATMSTGGSAANDPFGASGALSPTSPVKAPANSSSFKPFVPSSSFGRGLTAQPTGDAPAATPSNQPHVEDLLEDNDPEASKKITEESMELANLSSQISSLSKQMQDVKTKRTTTQNELNQTNSQKQNFEQRLAQLRSLYEKEAESLRSLEEQLSLSRIETQKLQGECMNLEGVLRDLQVQHQQVSAALQADQQENSSLRERIRAVNGEIAQLKPQIEKLKSEACQQKGLAAINKKQLVMTEGERDKLRAGVEGLIRSSEDGSHQADSGSPMSVLGQAVSPAPSTASGNNPFFKRNTDIMGAFGSPPTRSVTDKSFDDVFGPTYPAGRTTSPPPPVAAFFKQQHTGNSATSAGSFKAAPSSSPLASRQEPSAADPPPPPPPESKQITSNLLPFPDHTESLSSSRQVSPPASRAKHPTAGSSNHFQAETAVSSASTAAPGKDEDEKSEAPNATPVPGGTYGSGGGELETQSSREGEARDVGISSPFGNTDQAKAKADFDNAFAAFAASHKGPGSSGLDGSKAAFDTEFPPISELEHNDDSDFDSERGGFDDDFTPQDTIDGKRPNESGMMGEDRKEDLAATATREYVVPTVKARSSNSEHPSSPATITMANMTAPQSFGATSNTFGSAALGPPGSGPMLVSSSTKSVLNDMDDEFEGLEDAKESSADEDFANISRDDFNPVFDSSPSASQSKSESIAFGNESGFDFVAPHAVSGAIASTTAAEGNQAKVTESHDWDAIFAGLESTTTVPPVEMGNLAVMSEDGSCPWVPGHALTDKGEHDDPMVKNLTSMGYSRVDAVAALEKYDYNLEQDDGMCAVSVLTPSQAANHLASHS